MTEKPVTVYYFQVEDFHTYHVGEFRIFVHNADYKITLSREKYPESAKHIEDAIKNGQPRELTINRSGEKSNIKASLKAISKVSGKYNVPLVKTQMKKIIVTAKTLYSHPKNVSKIYAALHTDLAW